MKRPPMQSLIFMQKNVNYGGVAGRSHLFKEKIMDFKFIEPCPYCDKEGGCCFCDYSGLIKIGPEMIITSKEEYNIILKSGRGEYIDQQEAPNE